jgi:subtilisin family serine protease
MSTRRSDSVRKSISAAACGLVLLSAGQAAAVCGDPTGDGQVATNDALYTLRAGVAQVTCALSICDVDGTGSINTADALKILRNATGLPPALACLALPDDPRYDELWGMVAINAPSVWTTRTDCSDVTVAVLDSGIDFWHDDLRQNLWHNPGEIAHNGKDDDNNGFTDDVYGYDFAENDEFPWDVFGHGTHVAGTIGAVSNDLGVVGVCWSASLMGVRWIADDGSGFTSDALQAVDYARKNGARIMNNSWHFGGQNDSGLFFALKAANDAGLLSVVAAGNDGLDTDISWDFPGHYLLLNQINVAASTETGSLAGFSNFGKKSVHVAAPGDGILSTTPRNEYDSNQGTSMAAPHVAGAAALIWSEFPLLSALDIKQILIHSAAPSEEFEDTVSGGQIDLEAAFAEAEFVQLSGALTAGEPEAGAMPVGRSSKVLRSFDVGHGKYPKREEVEETFSNGVAKKLERVADHVVVILDQESAMGQIASAGFHVRGRLKTEQPTFLIEAQGGVDAAIAALEEIDGVLSASADYVMQIR